MTTITLMEHANLIEQVTYDNIDRNYEYMNDEEIERMHNLLKIVRNLRKQETSYDAKCFYKEYEDRYDYSYDVLDRGLTLQLFIAENPSYRYVLEGDRPQHFSDIPFEVRIQYRHYIDRYLKEHWDYTDGYTEQDAIHDFKLSRIDDKEEMIDALKRFRDAYHSLLDVWMSGDCDLNELNAISKYPFDKSFDELDIDSWIDVTLKELQ